MSWTCPNCHKVIENDHSLSCDACGYLDILELHLVGDAAEGEWRTRTDTDVNRRIYKRLYPGVEHQYVSHEEGCHPYSVRRKRKGWDLVINPESTLAVKLNDSVCTPGECRNLADGDVIWLASKEDASIQVAPVTVKLVTP